jgi:N-sulfoglucosamine sulfohydrolase
MYNIIYIHTHDTGRYIQPYGYPVPTPNLMGFAEQATLFRQAFCAAPTCSPSRAALLTGRSPHSNGMLGLAHRGFQLKDYQQHLARYLGAHGYETALCGVQHEVSHKEIDQLGYQFILKNEDKDLEDKDISGAVRAAAYIRKAKEKPFFLSFGMINTHREYPELNGTVNPDYVLPPSPLFDHAQNREDMARYMLSAQVVDQCFGIVWDAVKESGLEEHTIIVFTTDHGLAFPKMKCNLYDTGIGVSLIVKYPKNPSKGKAIDAMVSQIDLFPTLCEWNQLPAPWWLEGKSMVPLLNGEQVQIRKEVFSEVNYHAAYEPMRCIRTERYKLIRWYGDHDRVVLANMDDGLSKAFLLQHGFGDAKREKDMLFDLYLDPMERVNLIEDQQYAEIYEELTSRLINWMRETRDPLLEGKVLKPEGAIVNHQDCASPKEKRFE